MREAARLVAAGRSPGPLHQLLTSGAARCRPVRTGERPKDEAGLLQGLQEAHDDEGHPVQDWQGLPLRPGCVRGVWRWGGRPGQDVGVRRLLCRAKPTIAQAGLALEAAARRLQLSTQWRGRSDRLELLAAQQHEPAAESGEAAKCAATAAVASLAAAAGHWLAHAPVTQLACAYGVTMEEGLVASGRCEEWGSSGPDAAGGAWHLHLHAGKRRYDRKQSGYGGQTKPVFHKKVGAGCSAVTNAWVALTMGLGRCGTPLAHVLWAPTWRTAMQHGDAQRICTHHSLIAVQLTCLRAHWVLACAGGHVCSMRACTKPCSSCQRPPQQRLVAVLCCRVLVADGRFCMPHYVVFVAAELRMRVCN